MTAKNGVVSTAGQKTKVGTSITLAWGLLLFVPVFVCAIVTVRNEVFSRRLAETENETRTLKVWLKEWARD